MRVSDKTLEEIALTRQEYDEIVRRMNRAPNPLELGLFGALWSEHCGYKHSKQLLALLPSDSPDLLASPGEENAGAIDIGNGLAAIFKIESHNHPSAVEPYQGAATGVGGIVRDILAMGARPIALLNSLRFGPISEIENRRLFQEVVSGIAGYGNCIGIPDVGGEVKFSTSYSNNPLVNALCVGIVPAKNMIRAVASTPGHLMVLVGAETGRDGIHGASGLASRAFEKEQELRPSVQIGNPFLEKSLIESCLEVAYAELLEGMQDLGAAGLTSATVEAASKGGTGFELDVSLVPRREMNMTAYDVMLSESQERMLLIISPPNLTKVKSVFEKWDILCTVVGRITKDGVAHILDGDTQVAKVPIELLTHPPLYTVQGNKPKILAELQTRDLAAVPLPQQTPADILLKLLSSPNITSKEWVYRQYDHHVQTNTIVGPGDADSTVIRIRGTKHGLAIATDGNGRTCYLNPDVGGALAVAEACRNLVCTGARPLALTNCLNFGDPDHEEVAYQLRQCVQGMVRAAKSLGVPVVSGNVSLYNQTRGKPIDPTPIIGAVGIVKNLDRHCRSAFEKSGSVVLLLGTTRVLGHAESLAGSEYLELIHDLVAGQPFLDLSLETRLQRCCLHLIENGLIESAHDCSEGGLAVALAKCAIQGSLGFEATFTYEARWDAALFGETPSRIVVSLDKNNVAQVEKLCQEQNVPYMMLGAIHGDRFVLPNLIDLSLKTLEDAWRKGLDKALEGKR